MKNSFHQADFSRVSRTCTKVGTHVKHVRTVQKCRAGAAVNPTGRPPSWVERPFLAYFGHFAPSVFERTCPRAYMGSRSNLVRSLWTSWGSNDAYG